MADDAENLTIRLLQEMRAEMRDLRTDLNGKIDSITDQLTNVGQRIDGNTLLLNLIAGVVHDREQRISTLETGEPAT